MKNTFLPCLFIFLFCLFQKVSLYGTNTPFHNNNEANSCYFDERGLQKLNFFNSFLKENTISTSRLNQLLEQCFHQKFDTQNVCEVKILEQIKEQVKSIHPDLSTNYLEHVLLYARLENFLDDVGLYCLFNARVLLNTDVKTRILSNDEYAILAKKYPNKIQNNSIDIFKLFLSDSKPVFKAWRVAYERLNGINELKDIKKNDLKDLARIAYYRRAFSKKEFELIQQLLTKKAVRYNYTLSVYLSQKSLFLPQKVSRSFLTSKIKSKKTGLSYRQAFYLKYQNEKFFPLQVKALGELLEQFQTVVFESKVGILISSNSGQEEQLVALSAMEQYNFAVRQLRKAMIELEGKYYFYKDNKKIDFMDIIVAGQELDLLPVEVLDEVAKIEQLWNPKKTKGEKVKSIFKFVATTSGLVLSGPVSLVPAVGILVMESINKKQPENEKVHNLF